MPQRDPLDLEIELYDEAKQVAPETQATKRRSIVPPLSAREPFWWAVAAAILMVAAFAFVLFVARVIALGS